MYERSAAGLKRKRGAMEGGDGARARPEAGESDQAQGEQVPAGKSTGECCETTVK